MKNRQMLEIAMRQSAEDMECRTEDFRADKNVISPLKLGKNARKYLKPPSNTMGPRQKHQRHSSAF